MNEPDRRWVTRRYRECGDKAMYARASDAIAECERIVTVYLWPYQCSFCGWYHLSKRMPSRSELVRIESLARSGK